MKKILSLFLILYLLSNAAIVLADDGADFWDEPMKIDAAAKSQQKAVTDQEFEKVMQMFEKKKKKAAEKNKPKGNPIGLPMQENSTPADANAFKVTYEVYPTVMIPVTLITADNIVISPGYYRILSVKKNNDVYYLNFYQGSNIIAKVRAINTGKDYNQKSLNYTKIIPVNDDYMKVIYGDIDCNIEARLDIKQ